MSAAGPLPRQAVQVALAGQALSGAAALLVWTLDAGHQTRQLLDLSLAGPARDPGAAVEVAATNLRLLAAVLLAAWAVRHRPSIHLPLDLFLAALLALNAATVGAALGAYGTRLLEALALHGPLELAAFALAGGAYLAARSGELSTTALTVSAGSAVALLAAAALLETYVQLGGDPRPCACLSGSGS